MMNKIKITEVNDEHILFNNGKEIIFDHNTDCCEDNYADFSQLEELALETEFTEPLIFEAVEDAGFRFGNKGKMFFIPCYSIQNGYYTTEIDIFYDDEMVLDFNAEYSYSWD